MDPDGRCGHVVSFAALYRRQWRRRSAILCDAGKAGVNLGEDDGSVRAPRATEERFHITEQLRTTGDTGLLQLAAGGKSD